jgi:hypothetical protein
MVIKEDKYLCKERTIKGVTKNAQIEALTLANIEFFLNN